MHCQNASVHKRVKRVSERQTDREREVLKFGVRCGFGVAFYIEQDVSLGLHHRLLVGERDRAVVEMVPAPLVGCICCVMSRTNTKQKEKKEQ